MSYAGLVPSEHSSGASIRRGSITKTGNAHLRRVIVEAAWHYRHQPMISDDLRKRQLGLSTPICAAAWNAQQRLFKRYRHLSARGKVKQQTVVAIARELLGFVWYIGQLLRTSSHQAVAA